MEAALAGRSKCRNAAISEAFHYMKIMEVWGTGLGRIRNSCREYGLKEPTIEEFGDGFRVVFYRKVVDAGQSMVSDIVEGWEIKNRDAENEMSGLESVIENQQSDTKSNTENQQSDTESDIEKRLRNLILQYPEITQQAAAEKLGYSKSWIRRIMKKMQEEGVLLREGSTKKGL